MFNKQLIPSEEPLDSPYAEDSAEEGETPAPDYSHLTSGAKPGIDGLPLITLIGAIIVGILMWAGFFAIIGALLSII